MKMFNMLVPVFYIISFVWLSIFNKDGFEYLEAFFVVIFIDNFGEDFSYFSRCEFTCVIAMYCRYKLFNETDIKEVVYKTIRGGARGVMVIVVGNGHGDTSSNPGRD